VTYPLNCRKRSSPAPSTGDSETGLPRGGKGIRAD
jgi:hypothetical protein